MQTVTMTGTICVPQPSYRITEVCDGCTVLTLGTMFPTTPALIGPLFLCDACLEAQGGTINVTE